MQRNKKEKKPLTEVERYQAKMKTIGGIICLIALITAFVVGLFVGKAVERGITAKDTAVVDTVLTSDTEYTLSGTWVGNSEIDGKALYDVYYEQVINVRFVSNNINFVGVNVDFSSTGGSPSYYVYRLEYIKDDNTTVTAFADWSNVPGQEQYTKWYSSGAYQTIEIVDTANVEQNFYNWFVANYSIQVETYNVTYDLLNGVTVPYPINTISTDNLPVTIWLSSNYDDTGLSAEYMSISATNCEYYISDVVSAYSVGIVITSISGDVVITAENVYPPLTTNSTVITFIGSVYEYDYHLGNFTNCIHYFDVDDNKAYVIPIDETLDYSFTIYLDYSFDVLSLSVTSRTNGVTVGVPYDYDSTPAYNVKACDVSVSADVVNSSVLVNFRGLGGVELEDDVISRSFVDWLVVAVGGFFSFSIMPGLSIGMILGTILLCALVVWILKMFAGG